MQQEIISEIKKKSLTRVFWKWGDFGTAQLFLWMGILTSLFSSFLVATKDLNELPKIFASSSIISAIAAIPGIVIMIDKTFKFWAKSSWHNLYTIRLNELRREAIYLDVSPKLIAEKLSALELEMHNNLILL